MLVRLQVAQFGQQGLTCLPQAVPTATALAMRDRLWAFLSLMHGRRQDDPATWEALGGRTRFKTLMRTGAFDELSEHLAEPITDLLGPGAWNPPAHWGRPLVTFPSPGREWTIPATGWHVDSHQWSAGQVPGLVAFTFLDEVLPWGGGTLVMPGSPASTPGSPAYGASRSRTGIGSAGTSMTAPSSKARTFVSPSSAASPVTSC